MGLFDRLRGRRNASAPPDLLDHLAGEAEQGLVRPFGPALDIGCGNGDRTIRLARRGWRAYGVDPMPVAVSVARRAGEEAQGRGEFGVGDDGDAQFTVGPVTELGSLPWTDQFFSFFVDAGAYQHLDPGDRARYASGIGALAAPGAVLIMAGMERAPSWSNPVGVTAGELEVNFAGWRVSDGGPVTDDAFGPEARAGRWTWLRLRR